jgi:dolichol-phosphate mannosyltransferase
MSRLLINVATYNERENLPALLTAIWQQRPDADVFVVDDNSPDGTGAWCEAEMKRESRLACLIRPQKMGLGTATVEAFRHAIDGDYEWLLTMDADFSHPPRFIPQLLNECSSDVDLVIGSRYVAGGKITNWPWYRRLSSRLINGYSRWWLGISPLDCSGAFRCHRVSALKRLDLARIAASGYAFYEESLLHFAAVEFAVKETPIEFVDRTKGQSKIGFREAIRAVTQITKAGWKRQ